MEKIRLSVHENDKVNFHNASKFASSKVDVVFIFRGRWSNYHTIM